MLQNGQITLSRTKFDHIIQKCSIAQELIEYLGHKKLLLALLLSTIKHVDALLLQPHSQDVRGLQRFLGMINFYCHFLLEVARTLCPLTDALAGKKNMLNKISLPFEVLCLQIEYFNLFQNSLKI